MLLMTTACSIKPTWPSEHHCTHGMHALTRREAPRPDSSATKSDAKTTEQEMSGIESTGTSPLHMLHLLQEYDEAAPAPRIATLHDL